MRHLELSHLDDHDIEYDTIPRSLQTLRWKSLTTETILPRRLILENSRSLRDLCIGRECFATCRFRGSYLAEPFSPNLRAASEQDNGAVFQQLRSFAAVGLDIRSPRLDFLKSARLYRLSLESCPGAGELLSDLTDFSSVKPSTPLALKEFVFRHDQIPEGTIVGKLEAFLRSFTGLKLLSVLFDHRDELPGPQCFSDTHGQTLRILIWEKRRTAFSSSNYRYQYSLTPESLSRLCLQCPNLVELGISSNYGYWRGNADQAFKVTLCPCSAGLAS